MNITVVALGTRGDVQPMIALSLGLRAAGHTVRLVAGSNFAGWVQSYGLDFVSSIDMEALMQSEGGVGWTESSDNRLRQLRLMKRLLRQHADDMLRPLVDSISGTDLFVGGFMSEPFVQSVSEKHGIPFIIASLQPHRITRSGPASMTAVLRRQNSIVNRWTGYLGEMMIWNVSADAINPLRSAKLGLPPHTASSYIHAMRRVPTIYGISRHVVPPPSDWDAHVHISGYWFLDDAHGWQPPEALTRFLDGGPAPVHVGFGSMSARNPEATVRLVAEALARAGQRGIIASGWSGLRGTVDVPGDVYLLESAPHSWLFPRMAAVVHHGGAGTTAAGLRAGRPTLVIPHMSDQPFWGRRVHELGVGTKPIPRHKVAADNLAASIRQLTNSSAIHAAARVLGEQIRAENGVEAAAAMIAQYAASGQP